MTVWMVTMNGYPERLAESELAALAIMDTIKTSARYRTETWRPVGDHGWASERVTSLRIRSMEVEA